MAKKKLVVIFGGRSSEHEVSCISVQTVAKAVDTDKYDMTLIGITKDGKWLKADSIESIADGSWYDSQVRAVISPDSAKEIIIKDGDRIYAEPVDVIFPVCMVYMEKTVRFRDCLRWRTFHMWAAVYLHRLLQWTNSIQRSLLIISM